MLTTNKPNSLAKTAAATAAANDRAFHRHLFLAQVQVYKGDTI